jgi:hypothetical protein
MKLITEDTTLAEFERRRKWFVCCPHSGMVYKVEIIGLNMRSTEYYAWVTQNQGRARNMTIHLIGSPNTVIESRSALLHRIQTKQFEIRQ